HGSGPGARSALGIAAGALRHRTRDLAGGANRVRSTGPPSVTPPNAQERRILWIALALNAAMAVVGGVAGWIADSTGLLADALDMLSDATAYAIGLIAIGRTARFKANAALLSGSVLLL